MTTPNQPHDTPDDATRNASPANWLIVGLAMLMLFSLAGLWVMERGKRTKLQRYVDKLREQNQLIGEMVLDHAQAASPVDRQSLPAQPVTFDGTNRTALLLSASVGKRLGFQPGDVLIVTAPPATAPARE
jgi:hypothetical protein